MIKPKIILNYKKKLLAQISFMQPSQLSAFSPAQALAVAQALNSNNGQSLSPYMAASLGANIPPNTPLTSIASIASSVPLNCFANTNPAQLVSLIGNMDTKNMNPSRKSYLGSKVKRFEKKNNINFFINYFKNKKTDCWFCKCISNCQFFISN